MNLTKLYIIQSITAASNNLRLSTQKIEVVALLREFLGKSENLDEDIRRMKKITELSTLAIRLNEVYTFLSRGNVDFFKISDKFKEHSQYLIKDLNHMLDMVNPATFKQTIEKLNEEAKSAELPVQMPEPAKDNSIPVDLSKRDNETVTFEKSESERIKEKIILDDESDEEDMFFQNFEAAILKPIKEIDNLLKKLANDEFDFGDLSTYAKIMSKNGEMSAKVGFDIIAGMHKTISHALLLIKSRALMPGKEVIEAVRACLIVIVAVVRGKEVDITNYLNRAEDFGKKIQNIRIPS